MQNSVVSQGLTRKFVLMMPGLCTALTATCVMFFKSAPPAWRTDPVESITGGVLVSLSTLSFLAICKHTSNG